MDLTPFLILAATCLLLAAAVLLSLRRRVRALKALEEGVCVELPADLVIPEIPLRRIADPDERDQAAYAIVEKHRARVWWSFRPRTELSIDRLWTLSREVAREVAAVYHPEAEQPELRAGVQDLMLLNLRVTQRLHNQMDRWPLKMFRGVRVDQALWVREQVRKYQDSLIGRLVQRSRVPYKIGKWAWRLYNAASPWYWGRQAVYTGGREAALRYLLTSLVTFVGEEAVLTYSGRGGDPNGAGREGADECLVPAEGEEE
jgi:hypothetical protein